MPVLQKLLPLALPTLVLHRWHGLPYPEFPLVHRPQHFLPKTSDLQTGMSDEQIKHRDTYWHEVLVLEVMIGMAVAETCRLCITLARCKIHCHRLDHAYSQLPSETGAASADTTSPQSPLQGGTPGPDGSAVVDKSVMGDKMAVGLHVCYQTFCAAVALGAYKTDSLSLSSGLDFEWWALFVLINMIDGVLQATLRSASMPIQELEKSWSQFVAPKIALAIVPGISDRVDIQLDWAFISIVLQRVHSETDEQIRQVVMMLIAGAAILVIILAYSKIYMEPPLRSELKSDFFTILEPSEKDAVGIMDVARDFQNADKWGTFALQSMAKLASPAKQAIAKFEDVPQAVLKLFFIIFISGIFKAGPFTWFTAVLSLAKAALLPRLWRILLRGLPLRMLLRKLSSAEDKQQHSLFLELATRAEAEAATAEFAAALAKLSPEEQTRIYAIATVLSESERSDGKVLSEVLLQALALIILPPADREQNQTLGLLEAAAAQSEASPPRFPLLFVLLQSPTPALRTEAAEALREAGRCFSWSLARAMSSWLHSFTTDLASAPSATPELLKECLAVLLPLLNDQHWSVRDAAWQALGQLVSAPAATPELLKESFAALLPLVKDESLYVREAACEALGNLSSAPSATPELLKESFAALQPLTSDNNSGASRALEKVSAALEKFSAAEARAGCQLLDEVGGA